MTINHYGGIIYVLYFDDLEKLWRIETAFL